MSNILKFQNFINENYYEKSPDKEYMEKDADYKKDADYDYEKQYSDEFGTDYTADDGGGVKVKPGIKPAPVKPGRRSTPIRRNRPSVQPKPKAKLNKNSAEDIVRKILNLENE